MRVTGVDCSPIALRQARDKSAAAGVEIEWIETDVQQFGADREPVDFLFDRGCYHCCRRVDLSGYLATIENLSRPGTWMLCLAGNANEQTEEQGPPRVTESELREEFGKLMEIVRIRQFHFQDAHHVDGPLGWSTLMRRR